MGDKHIFILFYYEKLSMHNIMKRSQFIKLFRFYGARCDFYYSLYLLLLILSSKLYKVAIFVLDFFFRNYLSLINTTVFFEKN